MATILRERQVWKRPATARAKRARIDVLPIEQQENVRAAMHVLRVRMGSWAAVAEAVGARTKVVEKAMTKRSQLTAGLALHAARLAGVPVEDVLTGAFPKPGACPLCGRCD